MRNASGCLAAILAWAGGADAAPPLQPVKPAFDFPALPFGGGNVDPDWTIQLLRTGPGAVELHLSGPQGAPIAGGGLTSTVPVLNLPSLLIKGQYGLTGTVTIDAQARPITVLVGSSAKTRPCQDNANRKYGNDVVVMIGTQRNPSKLYFGCGEYRQP